MTAENAENAGEAPAASSWRRHGASYVWRLGGWVCRIAYRIEFGKPFGAQPDGSTRRMIGITLKSEA